MNVSVSAYLKIDIASMDASVGFLLENLKQLVTYQVELIGGAHQELKHLQDELVVFRAMLEDASRKYKKDELFEQWERRVREAVYDIEDIIDTYVTEASAGKTGKRNWFKKLFNPKGVALAEHVKDLRKNTVNPLMNEFKLVSFNNVDAADTVVDDARKTRLEKSQHIVGFEAETEFFVKLLTIESNTLEVCSIVGMAGLGKTTLAWKIYENSTIKFEFPIQLWVNVSDNLNMRKVLLDILSKFTPNPDESIKDEELLATVRSYLEEGKFLLVLDDVWKTEDWKKLKCLLPKNNQSGKVLITTRHRDVGNYASTSEDKAHNLRFLNTKESWELLQYEVFGKLDNVPQDLVNLGTQIAIGCKGLPLSIIVIGGILEEKTSRSGDNFAVIKKEWQEVSSRLTSYLVEGDEKQLLGSILSLSYDKLPYELRNCFLYLGVFPEDAKIPVKQLIRLWIAEGFIQESLGRRLEEVALDNLKELIKRNLVMVRETKLDGEAKICQVHDSIREVCKREGRKLNLFQEVITSKMDDVEKARRICIYTQALAFVTKKPKLPKSRTFLCFSESPITLEAKDIPSITDAFGLLRVYDAKNMKFSKFTPKLMQHLNHLRYLTLSVASDQFNILPESVTNLWNLQTLLVDTPSETLEIKGDLWKMRHLRHFKTKASIAAKSKGGDDGGQKLQTLSRLSPESCTEQVCKRATDLITLGIQGDLRILGESTCLVELNSLYKLKLVHQVRGGAAENPVRVLPRSHSFPPKLKIVVLIGTHLDWGMMSIFSAIRSLEVLKLKEKAFQGKTWVASGGGFPELVCLHIERATDLMLWSASNDHFPKLRSLYVNNCNSLTQIPLTLGKSLEMLSLERVTDDAINCGKEIVRNQAMQKRVVKLEIAAADRSRQS